MSHDPLAGDLLRALVREVLTDIVRESLPSAGPTAPPPGYEAPADAAPSAIVATARGGYAPRPAPTSGSADPPRRIEDVVVGTDDDLQASRSGGSVSSRTRGPATTCAPGACVSDSSAGPARSVPPGWQRRRSDRFSASREMR